MGQQYYHYTLRKYAERTTSLEVGRKTSKEGYLRTEPGDHGQLPASQFNDTAYKATSELRMQSVATWDLEDIERAGDA